MSDQSANQPFRGSLMTVRLFEQFATVQLLATLCPIDSCADICCGPALSLWAALAVGEQAGRAGRCQLTGPAVPAAAAAAVAVETAAAVAADMAACAAAFAAAQLAASAAWAALAAPPTALAMAGNVGSAQATFPSAIGVHCLKAVPQAFEVDLQHTVSEDPPQPLGGIGHRRSGIAALALSWTVGIGTYFLFVNLDAVPAAERAAAGLRNPAGPIAAPDFGSALIAIGVWQAVFFIALRGWPVNTIARRSGRLLAGNALVIGVGALTFIVLRNLAHWQPAAISAVCGCVISAALIVAMLFEGWPATRLPGAQGRALTLGLTALALALNRALAAYADGVHWTTATPDDWITTAALSFIGASVILHVGIGLRWPFAAKTKENS